MALSQVVKTEVVANIIKYEKKISHFYLDSVGEVTVGVGHLVQNRNAVGNLVMYKVVNNFPTTLASLADKQKEYDAVSRMKKNYRAEWYGKHTTLVMKNADLTALLDKQINLFYKELSRIYTKANGYPDDFDKLDNNVQVALFDMIFNLGARKLVANFTNFNKALKAGDWKKAASECNRPQLDPLRNSYVKNKLLAAAKNSKGVKP